MPLVRRRPRDDVGGQVESEAQTEIAPAVNLAGTSAPGGEELDTVLHLCRGSSRDELQETAHHLANRVGLLFGEDNSAVESPLRETLGVQSIKITDVEAEQDPTLTSGMFEVVHVAAVDHLRFQRALHVNSTRP